MSDTTHVPVADIGVLTQKIRSLTDKVVHIRNDRLLLRDFPQTGVSALITLAKQITITIQRKIKDFYMPLRNPFVDVVLILKSNSAFMPQDIPLDSQMESDIKDLRITAYLFGADESTMDELLDSCALEFNNLSRQIVIFCQKKLYHDPLETREPFNTIDRLLERRIQSSAAI